MKTIRLPFSAYIICALLFCSGLAQGQTIAINSVSGTSFCDDDSISVTFTAAGFWGHRNAFTLQLSDPTGSFSNFQNIGSLLDTLPGTFTINTAIPFVASSPHYRFRILAAIPYMTSADNGSDIGIWTRPYAGSTTLGPGFTGTPITFTTGFGPADLADLSYIANWDFGSGATPAKATTPATRDYFDGVQFSQDVMYSTPGDKTVTFTIVSPGGCSGTGTYKLYIYDCSNPSIPHDAIIINSDTTIAANLKTYWINPGFTLTLNGPKQDTIFAEPGSTISGAYGCILYMKGGSVLILTPYSGSNTVIFGNGASTNPGSSDFTLNCPTLDFDYTNAPPNAAHPIESVKSDLNSVSITLSPNPTTGMLSVQGLPSDNITLSVFNLLGEMVIVQKNPQAPDFTLDLSKLVPGTYYIRFSSANSVVTKMVVRE